jgi:DNA (cytosine-5)-methyltransferase 1
MAVPVIDLFAGPGGLGEGFSSLHFGSDTSVFRIALSIEMDAAAHETLELRSFFRKFPRADVPEDYYRFLRQEISREELFRRYPNQSRAARFEAWQAELGKESSKVVDQRIQSGLKGADPWILCGGPPCQAYSIIGRSRSGGIDDEDDRLYLYREYLRILAVHRPTAFVFENVKGILSSKVKGDVLFQQLLSDLSSPKTEVAGSTFSARYRIYSLTVPPRALRLDGSPAYESGDFVIRSEDYQIPQMRHRVILLGVREDCAPRVSPILPKHEKLVPILRVLKGLPRLRSGLSRRTDSKQEWMQALYEILDGDLLTGIPHGKATRLKQEIRRTLSRMTYPRADRGDVFVASEGIRSDHNSDWYLDSRIGGACNHESRPHMTSDLHRYLFAVCYATLFGRSPELRDYPPQLLPNHRNVLDEKKKLYFDDRFRVQLSTKPSTTITSHMAKDGHYFIHYDRKQCRALTVREAARLQTFPDDYFFCGTRTQQYVQVGNAVPPLLAYQIAEVVAKCLRVSESSADECHTGRAASVAC